MRRKSATTRLTMDTYCALQEKLGVFSETKHGVAMCTAGNAAKRVASWRLKAASSRLEFMSCTSRFVTKTKSSMMSDGEG